MFILTYKERKRMYVKWVHTITKIKNSSGSCKPQSIWRKVFVLSILYHISGNLDAIFGWPQIVTLPLAACLWIECWIILDSMQGHPLLIQFLSLVRWPNTVRSRFSDTFGLLKTVTKSNNVTKLNDFMSYIEKRSL